MQYLRSKVSRWLLLAAPLLIAPTLLVPGVAHAAESCPTGPGQASVDVCTPPDGQGLKLYVRTDAVTNRTEAVGTIISQDFPPGSTSTVTFESFGCAELAYQGANGCPGSSFRAEVTRVNIIRNDGQRWGSFIISEKNTGWPRFDGGAERSWWISSDSAASPTPDPTPDPTPAPSTDYNCGDVDGDGVAETVTKGQAQLLSDRLIRSGEFAAPLVDAVRNDPCLLIRAQGTWSEVDGSSQEVFADVAGPAVLPGRTVTNKYEFRLDLGSVGSDPLRCIYLSCEHVYITVGYALLEKTWFYTNGQVVSSGGVDPDKATLKGNTTAQGGLLGFSWKGVVSGSESDRYDPWNGNGKGAHISSRVAQIGWELPVAGFALAYKPLWNQELYIKAFADASKVECRGGNSCLGVSTP